MKNVKYLFAPYELALMAKEQGFNDPCFAYFNNVSKEIGYASNGLFSFNALHETFVSAPLFQQIFDWFYIKFGIWVTIEESNVKFDTTTFEFYITVNGRFQVGKDKHGKLGNHYEAMTLAVMESFKLIQ